MPAPRDFKCDAVPVGIRVRRPGGLGGRRLEALEEENRRLKRLLAESMLDNAALKDLLGKNVSKPAAQRLAVNKVMERHGLSQRHACRFVGMNRSSLRYRGRRPGDRRFESDCES